MGNIKLNNAQINKERNTKLGWMNDCVNSVGASIGSEMRNNIIKKSTTKITHSTYLITLGIGIARLFIFLGAIRFGSSTHEVY